MSDLRDLRDHARETTGLRWVALATVEDYRRRAGERVA